MAKSLVTKRKTQEFEIHPYDKRIDAIYKLIAREVSKNNFKLIKDYDHYMVRHSLAKATRLKHLQIILNLSRMIKKHSESDKAKNVSAQCPKCDKVATKREDVEKLFGFRNTDGFIRPQSWCRDCRK